MSFRFRVGHGATFQGQSVLIHSRVTTETVSGKTLSYRVVLEDSSVQTVEESELESLPGKEKKTAEPTEAEAEVAVA